MKKFILAGMIGLFTLSAFAGDLHLAKHTFKGAKASGKFAGKQAFRAVNKARKQAF